MSVYDGLRCVGVRRALFRSPSVSPSDAGRYCVKVTGLLNSVINCAVLTVQSNLTAIGPVDTVDRKSDGEGKGGGGCGGGRMKCKRGEGGVSRPGSHGKGEVS